jgi:IAA-amino acid hydrolase
MAFYNQAVPSAFVFLGIRNESAGSVHALHSPRFTLDESALPVGAALHASLAIEFLQRAAAAAAGAGKDEL